MSYIDKLNKNEKISITNIIEGIKHIKNDCYDSKNRLIDESETCLISEDNIKNISYFLSHKLPRCKKLNIKLEDVKNGKLISRGSYGYSFLIERADNTKTIIKIIVCNHKIKFTNFKNEINIHSYLSNLPEVYSQNFIKLYGYFINEPISKVTDIKTSYNYHDVLNKKNIICKFPTKSLSKNCEIFLNLEAGESDMVKYSLENYNKKDYPEIIDLFFDLLNYYKTSDNIIKRNKIFLHCDLKLDNLVLVKNINKGEIKKKIKIIDFGLSFFSKEFMSDTIGTKYVYNYLFNYGGKIYNDLMHTTPLVEIFIIIICYLETLFLMIEKKRIFRYSNDIDKIIEIINKNIKKLPINDDNKIKHLRIMALFNSIRYFYEKNIEEYLDNKYKIIDDKLGYITITRSTHPIETLQQFLSNCNIYYFNIKKHLGYTEEPKIVHITNDIKNKYEYFKSIIEYYLFSDFNLEKYNKKIRESKA